MREVPYQNAVGSVMYAMVCSRPDISYSIGQLSKFMGNPGRVHWTVMKALLKYLQHTSELGITFPFLWVIR